MSEKNSAKTQAQNERMNFMLDGSVYRGLLVLSLPILIGNILQGSYQFIDAYWISKISTQAVAASSAAGVVFFLILSLGM